MSLVALLALAGCGGGSSGGGGSSSTSAAVTGVTSGNQLAGSTTNQTQWQTAMAALAQASSPEPERFSAAAISAWNEILRRGWVRLQPELTSTLTIELQNMLAGQSSAAAIQILAIRSIVVDTQAAPQLQASAPSALQTLRIELPGAPQTWTIRATVDVGGYLTVNLLGSAQRIPISAPIDIVVSDIAIRTPMTMDLSTPTDPQVSSTGVPDIGFKLDLAGGSVLQSLSATLTQVLDPIIRTSLIAAEFYARQQIDGALQSIAAGPTWGIGAPLVQQMTNPPAMEPIADGISDEIQRVHMPFDQVYPAEFDQVVGGGVVSYFDQGDSAFWTGHYLAGESYRADLTGDPRATAGALRALKGIRLLLDPEGPQGGLLYRAAIPVQDPFFKDIANHGRLALRTIGGVQYGCLGGVSRDQYIGAMLGMVTAFQRVPQARADVAELVNRVLAYLDGNDWTIYMANGTTISTSFMSTPNSIFAFAKAGALVDPARWGGMHQQFQALADIMWFPTWTSIHDPFTSYYKYNLGHANMTIMFELETSPDLYRQELKLLRLYRTGIGHHQNAWFDAIAAMAIPTQSARLGAQTKIELERFTQRPRRGFSVQNSTDPSIQTAQITASRTVYNAQTGVVGTQTFIKDVALFPVPIEKRRPSDYLWQRSPFDLDGGRRPTEQYAGIDLLLPYWFGRSHGLFR